MFILGQTLSSSQSGQQQGRASHRNAEMGLNAGTECGLGLEWPALGQAPIRNHKYDQTPSLRLNRAPGMAPRLQ